MKDNTECIGESITPPRYRGIYLLPNLFTTAALFAGFYSIVAGMKGEFEHAATAMFIAMILDGLDGRVARLTGTQSAFGAQYDSLSDMVSFGLTPALVSYNFSLHHLGKMGWLAAFLYTAATALRLAYFNIKLGVLDKRFFSGLPCPAAAAVIAGMIWVNVEFEVMISTWICWLMGGIIITLALLMVSRLPYYSFKEIDFKGHVPFVALIIVVLIISVIALDPPVVLFGVFSIYALFGPFHWLRQKFRKKALTA